MERTSKFLTAMVAAAIALVLVLPATAAARPGKPKDPKPTTTTLAEAGRTCAELVDAGTMWIPGEAVDVDGDGVVDEYRVDGRGGCIDIGEDHATAREWLVAWDGVPARDRIKGLQLVFEQGIHGTAFAETVVTEAEGTWRPTVEPTGLPLVFVAMPHTADRWDSMTIVLTPGPPNP